MEMMKRLAVLSSMSRIDTAELDRLQRSVWDAEFEMEGIETQVRAGESVIEELIDSQRVLDRQKFNLQKFKQEMLEKYIVQDVLNVENAFTD
jgi:predicted  nucleic acid-binding Zn-ribbon protein